MMDADDAGLQIMCASQISFALTMGKGKHVICGVLQIITLWLLFLLFSRG